MKRLVLTLAICLGCLGILEAQNIWKPINGTGLLGVGPDGSIFAYDEYGKLTRSQDDGETWQIVLGQETGFTGHINPSCFAVSNEERIFVFNDNQQTVVFSDDNGDTWQQTPSISSCAMPDKAGLCVPTNDIMVVWAENGEINYSLDGGETWDGWIPDFMESDNGPAISDLLVNENGDVYLGLTSFGGDGGISHSTLSNIQNWDLVAFEGISIKDMAFDPEGNVVACGYNADGSSVGFQQIPGFYLFDGTSLAISDEGIVYTPHFMGLQAVLSYSTDHGEHFTEIGEHLPLVDIAPGGENAHLFKGADNHLYFDGGGEYWKSIRDADHIREDFPYDNMRWAIYYRNLYLDWAPYIQIGIKGDTIVDGTTYHKVIKCTSFGTVIDGDCFGGIRVETDGKWYFRLFSEENVPQYLYLDMESNTERLIYDFSLSVCDGFEYEGQYWMSVFDIDEIGINGSMRNRFWFDSNCEEGDHPHDWNWIEGIGSNYGLLYAIQAFPLDGSAYHLGEVYQDGELIYSDPYFHDYVPMIKEGNQRQKWNVVYMASMNYPNDYFTEIQSIRDNITLDGVDYKLVWKEDVYDSKRIAGAVREEDKRVYYRMYWQQSYQNEVLLYDFNLTVGDTVSVGWSDYRLIVLEESQVQVNGTMRRQLGLAMYFDDGTTGEVEEYWIEGVGSTYGFLNSGYEGWVGAFVHLLCYHENGNLIWDNEEFDDCVMNSDGTLASFAPQGAEWYFHVLSQGPITEPPFSYINRTVSGVEEVQGHTCSVIDLYDYVYEEDDIVYWYNQANDAFTVLYDFNAEAGESWYCDIEECSFLVTVQSVDNVTWNNRTYRTQYVAGYYADNLDNVVFEGKIIDGIGYEKGLFPNWGSCGIICGADYEYMRCYLEDGELLYHEGDYDCDYVPGNQPQQPQFEWYYEIQNEDGSITYQYMYQAGDTIINNDTAHILVKINTLYDKGLRDEVTHEYVYERDGKVYWWNKTLEVFTVLYDYEAEVGDYWEIVVGTRTIDMHVDAVEEIEYEDRTYRMLRVSDPEDLFSGNIVCGIGHLTSFFPEKLMDNRDGVRVEGMRCYWSEGELVFKYGDEDCDAVYSEVHGIEEDGPSTGSEALTVYPNPTNGVLNISVRLPQCDSPTAQTYRITNLIGQTLLASQIITENQQINVSSLPQGMYFITIAGETRKFVVR